MALATLVLLSPNSSRDLSRLQLVDDCSEKTSEAAEGKINSLNLEENLSSRTVSLQDTETPAIAKKILKSEQELEKVAFSSKSSHVSDAAIILCGCAIFFTALGLINPLFFAVALTLFMGAAYCGIESKMAEKEADIGKSQLLSIYQDKVQAEIAELEKLLGGKKVEEGMFTPEEFHTMTTRNKDDSLRAFSSYNQDIEYPYTVPGVESYIDESEPDAIFRYFAQQAVDLDSPEFVQECLNNEGKWLQNRARHICGFLKLLGDGNTPVHADINMEISMKNTKVAMDAVPLKTGELSTFCSTGQIGASPIMYTVRGDVVALYRVEDFGLPQAERQPVAHFSTSRAVTVFPPDVDGNVEYVINRTFKRIG